MKYSDVKWYLEHGNDVAVLFDGMQPMGHRIGYYSPSNANWSYQLMIVQLNNKLYEVLTQFGSVVGGREVILIDNAERTKA